MAICLSHGGSTIYSSDAPSTEMLVGTVDGIVFLQRRSPSDAWSPGRRALEGHHVIAIIIEPVTGAIVASMHDAGVAVSDDDGETWSFRNTGLPSKNVYCLASARRKGGARLYAGTEPAYLYCSDDFGRTWAELQGLRSVPSVKKWTFPAPPHDAHVKNIAIDPANPDVVYACVEQGGLFKSRDAGNTWQELQGFNDDCHRLLLMPSNSEELFLPTGYGFYVSRNGGESWTEISTKIARIGYPDPMVLDPRDESTMFVAGAEADPYHWMQTKSANPRIARSRDRGETWEIVGNGMPERLDANFEAMIIESWDGGSCVYAANTDGDIYASDDRGDSWRKVVEDLPAVSKTIHHTILRADLAFAKHQRPEA